MLEGGVNNINREPKLTTKMYMQKNEKTKTRLDRKRCKAKKVFAFDDIDYRDIATVSHKDLVVSGLLVFHECPANRKSCRSGIPA